MPKQFLHAAQIRAMIQHVRSKRVTQGVWADIRIKTGFNQIFVQLAADGAGAQTLAMLVDEQPPPVGMASLTTPPRMARYF